VTLVKIGDMESGAQPLVSAIIPTFNRVESLCRVLPSYLRSPAISEVIVVDDAGTDGTEERVRRWMAGEPRLRYTRNRENLGRGDWVLQAEDDLALGEGYVETLLDHALRTRADVIAGRRIWMRLGETQAEALARANRSQAPPVYERRLDVNSHAITPGDVEVPLLSAIMLVRREVFDRVQYDPQFGGQSSWREESDFQLSALEKGYKLVFCPHAVAYHYSRASQSYGRNRLKGTAVYAYRVYHNNLVFLRRHQDYLRAHHPRALLFGSPLASALRYGIYRTAWLLAAELVRTWRARKHGAFSWE
jgi:GT2 family glycosyltransferase